VYKDFVGKPKEKIPLERPRSRWEDGIGMDLRKIGWEVWIGFDWLRIGCHDLVTMWRSKVNIRLYHSLGGYYVRRYFI
jgi:hypothetical protein